MNTEIVCLLYCCICGRFESKMGMIKCMKPFLGHHVFLPLFLHSIYTNFSVMTDSCRKCFNCRSVTKLCPTCTHDYLLKNISQLNLTCSSHIAVTHGVLVLIDNCSFGVCYHSLAPVTDLLACSLANSNPFPSSNKSCIFPKPRLATDEDREFLWKNLWSAQLQKRRYIYIPLWYYLSCKTIRDKIIILLPIAAVSVE